MCLDDGSTPTIQLDPWDEKDLPLLVRLNAPEMMEHLGGPESTEQLAERHRRYVAAAESDSAYVFRVTLYPDRVPVGLKVTDPDSERINDVLGPPF